MLFFQIRKKIRQIKVSFFMEGKTEELEVWTFVGLLN